MRLYLALICGTVAMGVVTVFTMLYGYVGPSFLCLCVMFMLYLLAALVAPIEEDGDGEW